MEADDKGVYRWRYSVNLYRSTGILKLLCNVFGFIVLGVFIFDLLISGMEDFLTVAKWFLIIFSGTEIMCILSYYVYALIQGGRYTWDYEMDEKGISAVQVAEEAKRSKIIGAIVAIFGAFNGNMSAMGVGTTVATRDGEYSQFSSLGKVKVDRSNNTIKLRDGLYHNQVYVRDEDFDFVLDFIVSRCPKLSKKKGS